MGKKYDSARERSPSTPREEDADRAVVARRFNLLKRRLDVAEWGNDDPPHAVAGLAPGVGHVTVVATADGNLEVDVVGDVGKEDGGEDDFAVDAALVHVLHPRQGVGDVAHGGTDVSAVILGVGAADGDGVATLAGAFGNGGAVDHPHEIGIAVLPRWGRWRRARACARTYPHRSAPRRRGAR